MIAQCYTASEQLHSVPLTKSTAAAKESVTRRLFRLLVVLMLWRPAWGWPLTVSDATGAWAAGREQPSGRPPPPFPGLPRACLAQVRPEPLALLSIHRRRKSGGTKSCCRGRRRRSRRGCGRRPRPGGWRSSASRSGSWRSSASRSGRGSRSCSRPRGEEASGQAAGTAHGARAAPCGHTTCRLCVCVCVWMRDGAIFTWGFAKADRLLSAPNPEAHSRQTT